MIQRLIWLVVTIRVAALRTAEPGFPNVLLGREGGGQGGGRAPARGQASEKFSWVQTGTTATMRILGLCTMTGHVFDDERTKKKVALTSFVMEENAVASSKTLRGLKRWKDGVAKNVILRVTFGHRDVSIKGGPLTLRYKYNSNQALPSAVPIADSNTDAVGVDKISVNGAKFYVYVEYGPTGDVKKHWSLSVGGITKNGEGGRETFTDLVQGTILTVALVEKPSVKTEFAAGAGTQTINLGGYKFFFSSGTGVLGVDDAEESNGDRPPLDGTAAGGADAGGGAKLFHVYITCKHVKGKDELQFSAGGDTKIGCVRPLRNFIRLQEGALVTAAFVNKPGVKQEYVVGTAQKTINWRGYTITFVSVEGATPLR